MGWVRLKVNVSLHMPRMMLVFLVLLMLTTLPLMVVRCQWNNQNNQTAVDPCSHPVLYQLLTQAERFGVTAVILPALCLWLGCLVRFSQLETTFLPFTLFTHLLRTPPPRILTVLPA